MPLRSELFLASRELQACLTSDAAHVAPGARGEPVALIQSALVRLGVLDVDAARIEARTYGPRTAAAVLAYKRQFNIVNRAYQNSADNIVGKMTISSLDHGIAALDDRLGGPRLAAQPGPHPQSPTPAAGLVAPGRQASLASSFASTSTRVVSVTGSGGFGPPLSDLPADIQAVIRRSNDAKRPGLELLVPYLEKHEGPLSGTELTVRFAGGHSVRTDILKALHARMAPFDIWKNIKIIDEVSIGRGSTGIFCEPFDHSAFLSQMFSLTQGRERFPPPVGGPIAIPITESRFCKDTFNMHGARDSFREIVRQGPGLHICIPLPAVRSTTSCDLHIDEIQQGQVCSKGFCVPLLNGQTIDHLRTVGPWLAGEARKLNPF
jgi:peptidoglycan hydrolase-like protein with peptidoglycan-binding domain